ncbi:MAG: cytochrome c biogenesis protein ResB, partial [Candidatus Omnitrophica bacterium]|nr:cytochrome c biogenesis protein ResB [Candidatus Omnitrophota bacterium]
KLIDFRKKNYPGTSMAASFESDVELTDAAQGITLKRLINMNNPLKHRGFTLFQASYSETPVETTVLSVRKDPGVPLVYTGFFTVIAGLIMMFYWKPKR